MSIIRINRAGWRCLGYRLTKNGDSVANGRLLHHPSNVARFAPTEIINAENPTATLAWGVHFYIYKNEYDKTCQWIGQRVVPRSTWLEKSLEWLEENDEIFKYWKSIGVDYKGIMEEINAFVPPVSAALVCAYNAFPQCAFGIFAKAIEHPHVLLTKSWPPGAVPTVYCRGQATSRPVIAEYLTYRGLTVTGFAPTIPPSHLTLKTTSSSPRYLKSISTQYYTSLEDAEQFKTAGYAIPEPYASAPIAVGEKSLGSEEDVTNYKSAEALHVWDYEYDWRGDGHETIVEKDIYPAAMRFICVEVELSWAFPDERFAEAATITFSGDLQNAFLAFGDFYEYPWPSEPGTIDGNRFYIGGTMTGTQFLNAMGATGEARLKGTASCTLCASSVSGSKYNALSPGESRSTSLSWTDSPTVTPSGADDPGGWTELPLHRMD